MTFTNMKLFWKLPLLIGLLITTSSARTILIPRNASDLSAVPAIPTDFGVDYSPGPGNPLNPYHVLDAFLVALDKQANRPYNDFVPESEVFFDLGTDTIRIAVTGHVFPPRTLRVSEAMWGLHECAVSMAAAEISFQPGGCTMYLQAEKIGFIRVSAARRGPGEDGEMDDNGGGIVPIKQNVSLYARQNNNESSNTNSSLGVIPGTSVIILRGSTETGLNRFIFSIFESLITIAAITYPRKENPLVRFEYTSADQHTKVELRSEDSLIDVPSMYDMAVSGLVQLVRETSKYGSFTDVDFVVRYTMTKFFSGSLKVTT